jgi:DNA (cytosine-5)-methyltransferase 1
MAFPILSFFTGGGFLDIGFEQAGFEILWTNENNPSFVTLYSAGMSAWRKSQKRTAKKARISNVRDVQELTPALIRQEAFRDTAPKRFGIIGGPPCPDFSNGGVHAGHNGELGKLTKTFVQLIGRLQPTFFLIENVAGLYHFHKHRAFLESQVSLLRNRFGYAVDYTLLNALTLGVPQHRERLFVIGCRKQIAARSVGRRLRAGDRNWFPWPEVEAYAGAPDLPWPERTQFGGKPAPPKGIPLELTVFPLLYGKNAPGKLPNGREHFIGYSPTFRERDEGDVTGKSFKRLHRYRFSPTVWYGNQEVHLHPSEPRRLSVREALRIQTVPDEYVLPAEEPLSSKFKLIGNAVPCLMARRVAEAIASFLAAADSRS